MQYITVANGMAYLNDKKGNDKLPDLTGTVKFETGPLTGSLNIKIAMWKRDNGFSFKITEARDEN
jgi:hypothetical protein